MSTEGNLMLAEEKFNIRWGIKLNSLDYTIRGIILLVEIVVEEEILLLRLKISLNLRLLDLSTNFALG